MPKAPFTRAALDRNMTVNTKDMQAALAALDLSGLAIFDFGCGNGNLLRLLKSSNADTIYAFEVMPEGIDADIMEWAMDETATPRLILNPPEFKLPVNAPDGDLTGYDYFKLLNNHAHFAIVSNPPYFLYNRILSLTGTNLPPEDARFQTLRDKFAGALMITSKGRLHNHPGWHVLGILSGDDFNPPAFGDQYLLQTGFAGRCKTDRSTQPGLNVGTPQIYPGINNRGAAFDMTDYYPEMWEQLNSLSPAKD